MKRLGTITLVLGQPVLGESTAQLLLRPSDDIGEQEPLVIPAGLGQRGR